MLICVYLVHNHIIIMLLGGTTVLSALSYCSGFCMVANSLLAHASVNHLHYHFLYLDHNLMADKTVCPLLCCICSSGREEE